MPTKYFEDKSRGVSLYQDDCVKVLADLPPESAALIFADPPYFLSNNGITCRSGKMVSVNKGDWDVSRGVRENIRFVRRWLTACRRVLTANGTVWVSGTAHNIFTVGYAMQELGYKLLNDIVWFKRNAPPNLSRRRFTHSTETILWAAKSETSKYVFDYKRMKEENRGKQMRNVWEISPPGRSEKRFGSHPTQKPLALLRRIVAAASAEGDIVIDPFCGSGTTGLAAVEMGRRFIGIEKETEYLDLTLRRLKGIHAVQNV